MPQVVVGGAVDAGQCLPLVQQRPEPVHASAPVVAGRDLLGLGDHGLLGGLGLVVRFRTLGLASLVGNGEDGSEGVQTCCQAGEVADRVGIDDGGLHRVDAAPGLVRVERASLDPLLEESDLRLEGREAPREERQRLLGADVRNLSNAPLAVGGRHVDGAVGIDAAIGLGWRDCLAHAAYLAR